MKLIHHPYGEWGEIKPTVEVEIEKHGHDSIEVFNDAGVKVGSIIIWNGTIELGIATEKGTTLRMRPTDNNSVIVTFAEH